jgi:O-acetyl-ADP-ribose deacetylase (regulator of RNase III)
MKMDSEITYLKGDATDPIGQGNKIIVHICNDMGGWGKGFVMAISKRWKEPEKQYRTWYAINGSLQLGEVQFVPVSKDMWVANLIGQHKIHKDEQGNAPIRYDAIETGLHKLTEFAKQHNATVHMPRIGCGLAGGTWDKIEPIILNTLIKKQINVFVYDF